MKTFESRNQPREKEFDPQYIQEKKIRIHEYPRENILDPRNTQKKKYPTKGRWYDGTKFTRPTIACDP